MTGLFINRTSKFKTMKNIFYTSIIIALFSCKSIHGTYTSKEERLTFNADSTFEYYYNVGWHKKYSAGIWSKIGKNSYLIDSKIHPESIPVEQSITESSECSLFLNPTTTNDTSALKYFVYELVRDTTAIAKVKPFELIESASLSWGPSLYLRISLPDDEVRPFILNEFLYTRKFKTDCSNSNRRLTVTFPIDIDFFYLTSLKNDTIVLKGNKIRWRNRVLKHSNSQGK